MGLNLQLKRSIEVVEEVRVGKETVAENRTIWPIVKIKLFWALDSRFCSAQITPLAFLIIEQDREYALSIDGESMPINTILEMAPSLKDILEKCRKNHMKKGSRIIVS